MTPSELLGERIQKHGPSPSQVYIREINVPVPAGPGSRKDGPPESRPHGVAEHPETETEEQN